MSPEVLTAANTLREFLFERVYDANAMKGETEGARKVVRGLYKYFTENPNRLPEEYLRLVGNVERAAVDYIAGMTDQFALQMAREVSK